MKSNKFFFLYILDYCFNAFLLSTLSLKCCHLFFKIRYYCYLDFTIQGFAPARLLTFLRAHKLDICIYCYHYKVIASISCKDKPVYF